jgi:chromosome segregation ATPase
LYEVVDVPRSEELLEKAVRFFIGEKVFCPAFSDAVKLQQKGIKEIITADGTFFNKGMISGGSHQNIFKL